MSDPARPPGTTIWLTGFSGAGKTTIARLLVEKLAALPLPSELLDADELREGINAGLGFSREDRAENVRRIGEVAILLCRAGISPVVASISPYRADRSKVRERHEQMGVALVEVFVSTPLSTCEVRDPKGLYKAARAGKIANFTGLDDAYEAPEAPEIVIDTESTAPDEAASVIANELEARRSRA